MLKRLVESSTDNSTFGLYDEDQAFAEAENAQNSSSLPVKERKINSLLRNPTRVSPTDEKRDLPSTRLGQKTSRTPSKPSAFRKNTIKERGSPKKRTSNSESRQGSESKKGTSSQLLNISKQQAQRPKSFSLHRRQDNDSIELERMRNQVNSLIASMREKRLAELCSNKNLIDHKCLELIKKITGSKPWIPVGFLLRLTHEQLLKNFVSDEPLDLPCLNTLDRIELASLLEELRSANQASSLLLVKPLYAECNSRDQKSSAEVEAELKFFNRGRDLLLSRFRGSNYFERMNLELPCTPHDAKRKYRQLSLYWHPDMMKARLRFCQSFEVLKLHVRNFYPY